MYYQWSLASLPTSHWQTPQILYHQNPFRGQPEHLPIRGGAKMGGFTVQILLGSLSSPGDGIVKNCSADTGEEGKKGKINFRPGIEPGTQRLGVQYTRHQAITQDKSLSPLSFLCTTSGRWRICQPHTGRPPKSCAVRTPLGVNQNTSPSGEEPRWEDLLSRYYYEVLVHLEMV